MAQHLARRPLRRRVCGAAPSAVLLAGLALAAPLAAEPRAGLSETFEDWTVSCAQVEGALLCTMAQDVRRTGGDARLLGARIDLEAQEGPRLTLLLPMGLDLQAPVALTVGPSGAPFADPLPQVCQQAECYAFVPLTGDQRDLLDSEIAVRVRLTPFSGEAQEVPLSLRGFSEAFARLEVLAR